MTDLFSPRRLDGRAEWRVVYDLAVPCDYGVEITYERIGDVLDVGDGDRNRIHRAVRRCNLEFVREGKPRVLGNIRGVGYRILRPGDYATAAVALGQQARRKMTSAVDLMKAAPTADMTPAQRDWAHKVTMVMLDHEMRLREQDNWRQDAETRFRQLEEKAGIRPKTVTVDHKTGEVTEPAA